MKRDLSLDKAKTEAQFFGLTSAFILLVFLFVPILVVRLYISLFLFITSWLFLFHGATVVSIKLRGKKRRIFQIALSLAFPAFLSLYFIHDISVVAFPQILGAIPNIWLLIPIAFIGYMSWAAADQLDQEHPFRGFVITSTILFFICYFGHHGIYFEDDRTAGSGFVISYRETAKVSARAGGYFVLYIVYVAVAYGAMLVRFRRLKAENS